MRSPLGDLRACSVDLIHMGSTLDEHLLGPILDLPFVQPAEDELSKRSQGYSGFPV
jgi:hypothetical protein